ncbi:hypothetical protein RND81_05G251500 [Saponaria officinalis]|uniref:Transmembrane 9 superfamily member n=1 Tax=Saponaria officinalis TaxID=3572 RepID=A0AAW1KWD2_SAPOF
MLKIHILLQIIVTALINFWVLPISSSFSSPINHVYSVGDQVPFFANKVGPLNNPSETYEYYELPFCPPDQLIKKKESLGEVLNGDRLTNTRYDIKFKEIKERTILCTKTLKREEVKKFRDAIQREFYFQMHYDDLPFWGFIGKNEVENLRSDGKGPRSYLFTHVQFNFLYNGNHVVEVRAFSDPNHALDITEDAETGVQFTYSATWNETSDTFATRMSRYSRASLLPPVQQLHKLSLISSAVIFTLSVALVFMLFWWNIERILRKYIAVDEDNTEAGLVCSDGDFSKSPPYLSLLCAVLGCGTQIFLVVCCLFVLISLGIIEPYSRGSLWTSIVVMYTLTSALAGYSAVSYHRQFADNGWERSVLLTGVIFVAPVVLVMAVVNTVAILYGSTAALPFGTIFLLFFIYSFITVPFLALGGIIGNRYSYRKSMSFPKRFLRDIPLVTWYMKTRSQMLIGGLLPFSGILMELHLFYASLWSYKLFAQLGGLFVTFFFLVSLTAILSIVMTYVQFSGGDPRWWWRSVLRGGSTAIFMFCYCLYFYSRSSMSGLMQLTYFVGFNLSICYAFFLMLGAISFGASSVFMSHIYHAVKSE